MPPSKRRDQLRAISSNKKAKTGHDNATIGDVTITIEDVGDNDDTVSDTGSLRDADQYSDTTLVVMMVL